MFVEKTVL